MTPSNQRPAELDDPDRRSTFYECEVRQRFDLTTGDCAHYVKGIYVMADRSRQTICLHCGHRTDPSQ